MNEITIDRHGHHSNIPTAAITLLDFPWADVIGESIAPGTDFPLSLDEVDAFICETPPVAVWYPVANSKPPQMKAILEISWRRKKKDVFYYAMCIPLAFSPQTSGRYWGYGLRTNMSPDELRQVMFELLFAKIL